MALIQTRVDDLTDARDATQRGLMVFDGKKVTVLDIDLVDETFRRLWDKFSNAMSTYMTAGRVVTVKRDDAARIISEMLGVAILEPPAIEPPPVAEPAWTPPTLMETTETPPVQAPKRRRTAARKPKARNRGSVHTEIPPESERPLLADGRPYRADIYARTKRPGIRGWHERNAELLMLPTPSKGGRTHKAVEDAFDRYGGKDPDPNDLHPVDMDRLTTPTEER